MYKKRSKDWKTVVDRLLKAYNEISKSINPSQLVKLDLTSSQMKVLIGFSEIESFTMTELSTLHSVSVSTMTSMVGRLILNGLLKREKDDTDRRIVRVCLTAAGGKVVRHLMKIRRKALEEFLVKLDGNEIKLFLESIENVAGFLSKARNNTLRK
jgi:DNA-binding MarR family transcriptional regulator